METKEKKTAEVELITKEQIDNAVKSLTKAQKHAGEEDASESRIDFEKTKEVLRSLEGASVQTAIAILSTAFLFLPLGAIAAVLDMGKATIKAKALSTFFKMLEGTDCPDCKECKDCADDACSAPETKE